MRTLSPLALLVVLAGCQSVPEVSPTPSTPPAPVVSPPSVATPAIATVSLPVAAVPVIDAVPQRTDAALAVRDALVKGPQPHQVLMQSAFRGAVGFTTVGWSGLILSPKDVNQVRGTGGEADFAITRVEVHPLADGRLRVWAEIANQTAHPLAARRGVCEFLPAHDGAAVVSAPLPPSEPGGKALVCFESPHPQATGYLLNVRPAR